MSEYTNTVTQALAAVATMIVQRSTVVLSYEEILNEIATLTEQYGSLGAVIDHLQATDPKQIN